MFNDILFLESCNFSLNYLLLFQNITYYLISNYKRRIESVEKNSGKDKIFVYGLIFKTACFDNFECLPIYTLNCVSTS